MWLKNSLNCDIEYYMRIQGYNDRLLKERRQLLRRETTTTEQMLWQELRGRRLHGLKFFRQYGVWPYILDFYCPEIRLSIEIDGSQHAEESQVYYDKERILYLQSYDIREIRFWNHEVNHEFKDVILKIIDTIRY